MTNQPELPTEIPMDVLRSRSLFVATPMYGGQAAGMYTKAIAELSAECARLGIPMRTFFMFNESLITRARNYCVDEFLRSGFSHLMFIDADIGFNAQDVLAMLGIQGDDTEFDILAGPYAKKCIAWEKIKAAVDRGLADKDPRVLENFVGDYVFNMVPGQSTQVRLDRPIEVMETGTGFMMIRRSLFEKHDKAFPHFKFTPDHVRTENFGGDRQIMAYFDCVIDPESNRYLSEDYFFCQNTRKVGGKVWLCPWMGLKHVGTYVFGGSLSDIISIGQPLTAKAEDVKPTVTKKKK